MRRILFVLIFIVCVGISLLPDYPTQARPMLTVPEGTPRPRRAIPVVIATPVSVDSEQWTVDSEEGRNSLGGGFSTSGGRLAPDESEEVADPELSTVQYLLSTQLSVLPTFAMQDEEIIFSVTVSHEHESTSDEKARVAHDVVVSQELPAGLTFVRADQPQEVGFSGGITSEGRRFFQFSWPTLAAGEHVTAQVTLRVAKDAPSGAALSFLSVTRAEESPPQTSVVRIGTPPTELPDFEDW